jgi:hypothetical protein
MFVDFQYLICFELPAPRRLPLRVARIDAPGESWFAKISDFGKSTRLDTREKRIWHRDVLVENENKTKKSWIYRFPCRHANDCHEHIPAGFSRSR